MGVLASAENYHRVEVARVTPVGRTELVSYAWNESFEATIHHPDHHMADLCLSPRPQGARARFSDIWARNRFERVGGIFLLPAGFSTEARTGPGKQRSLVCRLAPDAIARWLDDDQPWSEHRLTSSLDINAPLVRQTMSCIARELEMPGLASDMMLDLLNLKLAIELGRFFKDIPLRACGGLAPWRLRMIDERVHDLSAAPTLEELAKFVGLSVRQLTRGFRTSRGKSIGTYVEEKRIGQAKLLLETDLSIKEIAFRMGFASPSGFTYAFRSATGETPRSFRAVHFGSRLQQSEDLRPDFDILPQSLVRH